MIMTSRARIVGLSILFICASVMLASSSLASIFKGGGRYFVQTGDTINDDLYLWTTEGAFDGVVTRDLTIFSRRYILTGEVNGNINSFSQYATVRGTVGNSVRLFAQTATIDGSIGNNLIIFASDVELSRGSKVANDVTIMGGESSIYGEIVRNLTLKAGQVSVSGKIGGSLNIKADKISIVAPAEILGSITYESKKEIQIDSGVVVTGMIDRKPIKESEGDGQGTNWPFRFVLFLCALITGLILITAFKRFTKESAAQVIQKPLLSLGIGFVSFCMAPFAVIILAVTVIGIPSAIILLFSFTVFFYVAKVYVAIALGRLGIRLIRKDAEPRQGWSLLLGLFVLFLIFAIPLIGWVLYLGTVFWGFGAIVLGIRVCRAGSLPAAAASTSQPIVS